MCVSPITITRFYPSIGTRSFTVPCGKCPECVAKKQSQIEALSVLQANKSGRVAFFTFTYRNDTCPVALSEETPEGVPNIIGFERGVNDWLTKGVFKNRVLFDKFNFDTDVESFRCPSLCREDIKKVLKRFRRACERLGEKLDMSYLVFGEYGEHHGRPHYHGLFYGLSDKQSFLLRDLWQKSFGFCLVLGVGQNKFDTRDVLNVSQYISKYVSKGVYTKWQSILPYVEKPRRQSSIRFGLTDDDTIRKLASFMMDAISSNLDAPHLLNSLALLIGERFLSLPVVRLLFPIL